MAVEKDAMKQRNEEIGQVLTDARVRKGLAMADCASAIGTTRQRYSSIERGESFITAVELEVLMRFLRLSPQEVWAGFDAAERKIRRLPVTVKSDEILYLIVDVAEG